MTNNNCLEDLQCPECRQEESLKIAARVMCFVTDEGSEPFGDHDWDDDSVAVCPECDFIGPLKAFRKLPPDPDEKNDERADWAETALQAFIECTGTDRGDALPDLLCDLMHWCDRNQASFLVAMERAQMHYDAETLGETTATKEGE